LDGVIDGVHSPGSAVVRISNGDVSGHWIVRHIVRNAEVRG